MPKVFVAIFVSNKKTTRVGTLVADFSKSLTLLCLYPLKNYIFASRRRRHGLQFALGTRF